MKNVIIYFSVLLLFLFVGLSSVYAGYKEGFNNGYKQGYTQGYKEGIKEGVKAP